MVGAALSIYRLSLMIQASQNVRFTSKVIAVASVIAWGVALALAGLLTPDHFASAVAYLGTATLAGFASALALNRYLWHVPLIRNFVGCPDFSGRWEGWYLSTFDKRWRPTAHEIKQRAFEIAAEAWGGGRRTNWSRGTSAAIITDRFGGSEELVWSYKTELVDALGEPGDTHAGTHYLRLSKPDEKKRLVGTYVNNRRREDKTIGGAGFVRLVWVGSSLKGALAYDETSWGMSQPTDNPMQ
jgi:hypothetical protein